MDRPKYVCNGLVLGNKKPASGAQATCKAPQRITPVKEASLKIFLPYDCIHDTLKKKQN